MKQSELRRILHENYLPPDIVDAFRALLYERDHNLEEWPRADMNWRRFFQVFDAFCRESSTFTATARFDVVMLLFRAVFSRLEGIEEANREDW